jgi:hypothetical protein
MRFYGGGHRFNVNVFLEETLYLRCFGWLVGTARMHVFQNGTEMVSFDLEAKRRSLGFWKLSGDVRVPVLGAVHLRFSVAGVTAWLFDDLCVRERNGVNMFGIHFVEDAEGVDDYLEHLAFSKGVLPRRIYYNDKPVEFDVRMVDRMKMRLLLCLGKQYGLPMDVLDLIYHLVYTSQRLSPRWIPGTLENMLHITLR